MSTSDHAPADSGPEGRAPSTDDDWRVPRIVVVTGAGGGIGSAVVEALSAEGYRVFAADVAAAFDAPATGTDEASTGVEGRGVGAGAESESASRSAPGAVVRRRVAVNDEAEVDALFSEVAEYCVATGGRLHAVVNVAGVLYSGSVLDMPAAEWTRLFDVNAFGVFLVSRAGLRLMREQDARGEGNLRSIVTVASNSAVVPRAGMAGYAASKAAASHFTRSLGLEAAAFGVRCNVVDPGTTRTPMVTNGWADPSGEDAVIAGVPADFKAAIPLGRIAEPADIAGVVAFVVGTAARHMTLQELVVDGGAAQR